MSFFDEMIFDVKKMLTKTKLLPRIHIFVAECKGDPEKKRTWVVEQPKNSSQQVLIWTSSAEKSNTFRPASSAAWMRTNSLGSCTCKQTRDGTGPVVFCVVFLKVVENGWKWLKVVESCWKQTSIPCEHPPPILKPRWLWGTRGRNGWKMLKVSGEFGQKP